MVIKCDLCKALVDEVTHTHADRNQRIYDKKIVKVCRECCKKEGLRWSKR